MKNNHKRKRLIFLGSVFAISIAALVFIIVNFRENIVFFYSPSELRKLELTSKIKDRQIRVGGLVKAKTVKKIDALTTQFIITDLEQDLKITYTGLLPDLFREKQGVVAKGKFDEKKNEFFSNELLIKHDENYMPPEVAKSLKKQKTDRNFKFYELQPLI
jgi:cytochrome c-type biogenesis protein CcmE